jgi:hypothetical protein
MPESAPKPSTKEKGSKEKAKNPSPLPKRRSLSDREEKTPFTPRERRRRQAPPEDAGIASFLKPGVLSKLENAKFRKIAVEALERLADDFPSEEEESVGEVAVYEHKEALKERVRHLRRSDSFQALAKMLQDPDLRQEYDLILGRREKILELQQGEEKHRALAPMLIGLMMGERTKPLLDMVIDESVSVRSQELKNVAQESSSVYVPEIVLGAGVHGSIYNLSRQMVVPSSPSLTLESEKRIGGQFAQVESPGFRLNSRTRPMQRDAQALPGTKQTLNTFTDFAVTGPADTGNEAYQMQSAMGDHARINQFLSGETMTDVEVDSISKNRSGGQGKYSVAVFDRSSFERFFVTTDRVIFTTGVGKEKTGLETRDLDTREILEAERDSFEAGESPRVLSFQQATRLLGNPENPYPLKNFKNIIISGEGDGAKVLVGMFLGYEGSMRMSTTQLDRVESISWIGLSLPTKEQFLEECRARYHLLGLELPRADAEKYYHRITPYPGLKASRLRTGAGADNIKVLAVAPNGQEVSFEGDHYIYSHGFEDSVDSLVDLNASSAEEFSIPEVNDGLPIAKKFRGEDVYIVGPAAKLKLQTKEVDRSPELRSIPENTAAVFRYADYTRKLAEKLALDDKKKGNQKSDLFSKADRAHEQARAKRRSVKGPTRRLGGVYSRAETSGKVAFNMPFSDMIRLGIGTAMEDVELPTRIKAFELTVGMEIDSKSGPTQDLELRSDVNLPPETFEALRDSLTSYAGVAVRRLINDARGSPQEKRVKIIVPVVEGEADVAKIRYEVLK